MRRVSIGALVAFTLLVACDGGESDHADHAQSPAAEFVSSGTCENEQEVAADETSRTEQPLSADVDGDGSADEISVHLDASAPADCFAFLVVEVRSQTYSLPIWEIGQQGGLPEPRLKLAAEMNVQAGAEIAVDEVAGASTQFVGLFTLHNGHLRRVEPEGDVVAPGFDALPEGLFGYGGSVGHIEAVDCADTGHIVVAVGFPAEGGGGRRYAITQLDFLFDGALLRLDSRRTERVRIDELQESFPEYESSPFGSCPTT